MVDREKRARFKQLYCKVELKRPSDQCDMMEERNLGISPLNHFGDRINNVDFIRLAVSLKRKTLNLAV